MDFLYLNFYACMRLLFLVVQTSPGLKRPVPNVCTILCSNVRGQAGNHSDLTVDLSHYNILLCSETLVTNMRHVSKIRVPGFGRPVLLCRGKKPRARGMAHSYKVFTEHFANPNLSVVAANFEILGCVV